MKSVVLSVLAMAGVVIGISGASYGLYSFFAPRYASVDRQVFEQSQAYTEGMVRDLENLKVQYETTKDGDLKAALKATIIHRFSVYNGNLPPQLAAFYADLTAPWEIRK